LAISYIVLGNRRCGLIAGVIHQLTIGKATSAVEKSYNCSI